MKLYDSEKEEGNLNFHQENKGQRMMTGKGERKECNNKYKRLIPQKEKTHSGKKKKKKETKSMLTKYWQAPKESENLKHLTAF